MHQSGRAYADEFGLGSADDAHASAMMDTLDSAGDFFNDGNFGEHSAAHVPAGGPDAAQGDWSGAGADAEGGWAPQEGQSGVQTYGQGYLAEDVIPLSNYPLRPFAAL